MLSLRKSDDTMSRYMADGNNDFDAIAGTLPLWTDSAAGATRPKDEYAFWRMNLSIRTNPPNTGVAVNDESVDRILESVGEHFIPPELDEDEGFHRLRRWLILRHLK